MERTISGKEIYRVALNIHYFDAIPKKKITNTEQRNTMLQKLKI